MVAIYAAADRRELEEGTSAHRQLELFQAARDRGESRSTALQGVVDWLIETTVQ